MSCLDNKWRVDSSGCHVWIRAVNKDGYGVVGYGGKTTLAHRLSYQLANPDVRIDGMEILHTCDTPSCINPEHLMVGTHADNMRDMVQKGRSSVLRGDASPNTKIPQTIREEIRQLYASGSYFQKELATMFNVSQSLITLIVNERL